MVFVSTGSRSAPMMSHHGEDVARLYTGSICFANFFDKAPSKPQDGHQTRQAELGRYRVCLRPLGKRIAGNDTSLVEAQDEVSNTLLPSTRRP